MASKAAEPRSRAIFCFVLNRMRSERWYYVYMMQSPSRRALYIGVTGNLQHRVYQHKQHVFKGFSSTYNTTRLVYYERFHDVHLALEREAQLKHWRRTKKEWLIAQMNPNWIDLAEEWGNSSGPVQRKQKVARLRFAPLAMTQQTNVNSPVLHRNTVPKHKVPRLVLPSQGNVSMAPTSAQSPR
jgi:putative endonuclease